MTFPVPDASSVAIPAHVTAGPRPRWFYVGMGVVAILIVIVGFSGPMPGDPARPRAFSPLVLLHGAVFGSWLLLFVAQARLVATRRTSAHRRLGLAAVVPPRCSWWAPSPPSRRRGAAAPSTVTLCG